MPHPLRNRLLFSGQRTYIQKVLSIQPANLLAYWPLSESSGTTIIDRSSNGRNGTYTGVDLGQTGIGDGGTAPLWDGVNDYGNVYSAGLAGAFNKDEGTVALWLKATSWTDGTVRVACSLRADASNLIALQKASSNNTFSFFYIAGGTTDTVNATVSSSAWVHVALTWSKAADQLKAYVNGVQSGSTQTTLGTWAGAINSTQTNIGCRTNSIPDQVWSGNLAHVGVWNTPLSAAQIVSLATL